MRIQKQPSKKSRTIKIVIAIILGLVLLLGVLEYMGVIDVIPSNGPNAAQKAEQKKSEEQAKKDFLETDNPDSQKEKDADTSSNAPVVPLSPDTIELSAQKTSSNEVTIFTKLQGYSAGSCELTIKKGDKTVSKTAPIIYQDNYSICAGFTVMISDLGSGKWDILLGAKPSGGEIINKSITYEVTP